MKKFTLLLSIVSTLTVAQTTIFTEDFEDVPKYTTSTTEFTDNANDFFIKTNGSNIGSNYVVTGKQGANYFAAQDINGLGATDTQTMFFNDININGINDLQLIIAIAEDDAADGNQDWDTTSFFIVEIDIDNSGVFTKILQIASQGITNSEPGIDTDFDGIGEGTKLSATFTDFIANISGTGSLLDLKLTFAKLNAGDEDIAIDNIRLNSTTILSSKLNIAKSLTIYSNNGTITTNKGKIVRVTNTLGQSLDNNNLSANIYFVTIKVDNNTVVKKIWVE